MLFDSLSFVYTGPAESVIRNVYTRPAHPTASTTTAGRATFVCGFTSEMILAMLGPNPTQECFRLAAYYLTDLAFQASGAELLTWGDSWNGTTPCTPTNTRASRTTW
jgi:hypothetical protein